MDMSGLGVVILHLRLNNTVQPMRIDEKHDPLTSAQESDRLVTVKQDYLIEA